MLAQRRLHDPRSPNGQRGDTDTLRPPSCAYRLTGRPFATSSSLQPFGQRRQPR